MPNEEVASKIGLNPGSPLPAPRATQVTDEMTFNTTPNQLTLLRMAFVPVVVGLLFLHINSPDPADRMDFWAGWAFTFASITDYFDGYLARRHKIVTVYGKLMDPLADKFLVVSALIMLQAMGRIHPVVVIVLICRELAITGLRALASAEGVIIAASNSGKWKTGTQMVAIPFLMGRVLWGIPIYTVGMVLLYISLAISLWSAKDYVVDFFRAVKKSREMKAVERRNAREARHAARAARLAKKAKRGHPTPTL